MNLETTQSQTLAKLTQEISIILVGTILLTLSAKIVVPFYPVPMSTQTLVVLGLGLFLGPVRSSLVVVTYLFEGLLRTCGGRRRVDCSSTARTSACVQSICRGLFGFDSHVLRRAALVGWLCRLWRKVAERRSLPVPSRGSDEGDNCCSSVYCLP